MRRNLREALLWMSPVVLLAACGGSPEVEPAEALSTRAQSLINPPTAPASGNIADAVALGGSLAVGGSVQVACGQTPGYDGFEITVPNGAQLKLEVTHLGSSMYLDTGLFVYGPKDANGSFGTTALAQDDDSGYGELSKIGQAQLSPGGTYLAVVGWGNAAGKQYRLQVDCVGGACITNPQPAPASYTLSLAEQAITPQLQSMLASANTVREDMYSYLRRFNYVWPYSTVASLDSAAAAILARSEYAGYRSPPAGHPPRVLTYAQLQGEMYSPYAPMHPVILSTYSNGTETVSVKSYFREFSTGPNGDNWRTLNIIHFPQSNRIIVYEQTAHEI